MEKVKLPKEVAIALDNARMLGFENVDIVQKSFEVEDNGPFRNAIRDFAADNFDLFLNAIVNGYEVEQTPEDIVREYYKALKIEGHEWERTHSYANVGNSYYSEMEGIARTLGILGITIPGVNGGETE